MGTPDDAEERRGCDWQRLRDELAAWLLCRFRRSVDASNIAGDAVLLAMHHFRDEPEAAAGRIWRWLCRTAVNRVHHDHRRAKRCEILFVSDVNVPASVLSVGRTMADRWVEKMLATTQGVEHRVLQMLRVGLPTNEEMAAAIGVDKRTIERARAKLRRRFRRLLEVRGEDVGPEHL